MAEWHDTARRLTDWALMRNNMPPYPDWSMALELAEVLIDLSDSDGSAGRLYAWLCRWVADHASSFIESHTWSEAVIYRGHSGLYSAAVGWEWGDRSGRIDAIAPTPAEALAKVVLAVLETERGG